MPLFGACAHCEDYRQQRDRAQQELSHVLQELASVTKDALAIKRHELGLPPTDFKAVDPLAKLGPKTKAACNEMSGGSASFQSYLVNWALTEVDKAQAEGEVDSAELDTMLAHAIREGETG